ARTERDTTPFEEELRRSGKVRGRTGPQAAVVGGKPKVAQVEPREVGRLGGAPPGAGQVLSEELAEERAVRVERGEERVEPVAPLAQRRGVGQHRDVARPVADLLRHAREVRSSARPRVGDRGLETREV